MPVSFSITGLNADDFIAEWMRVIPFLGKGNGQIADVATDADDNALAAVGNSPEGFAAAHAAPLNGEVIPPNKATARRTSAKKTTVIEGTATETPADKPADAPVEAAKTDTVEKKLSADDVRAAFNALMKASPEKEEAVFVILKEFKVKNATEIAGKGDEFIASVIKRCFEEVEKAKVAAATA